MVVNLVITFIIHSVHIFRQYFFVERGVQGSYRHVRVKIKDFSMTSKTSPTVFKDLKLMKNTDLSVKILLQKC